MSKDSTLNETTNKTMKQNDSTSFDECMLTTFDNPFNPFEDFDSWFMFDTEKGYDSCAYLARIVKLSDQFTEKETCEEIERAIDEIIKYDPFNIYTKIKKK